jgi:hypothetical protein
MRLGRGKIWGSISAIQASHSTWSQENSRKKFIPSNPPNPSGATTQAIAHRAKTTHRPASFQKYRFRISDIPGPSF